ncbi:hypothetical protein V1279_006504 [Bradyrhizobium sp. AZCC 1610]
MSRPNTTEVYTRVLVRAPKDEDYLVSLSHAYRILPTSNPWRVQYGRRMGTRWMFAPPSSKASRNAGGSEMSFIKPRRNGTSPVRKRRHDHNRRRQLRLRLALRRHRRFKSCPIDLPRQARIRVALLRGTRANPSKLAIGRGQRDGQKRVDTARLHPGDFTSCFPPFANPRNCGRTRTLSSRLSLPGLPVVSST